jgi:four helix bundle protein
MEKPVRSHRDLIVWQKAMDLAEAVYRLAAIFPSAEMYRLSSQVMRAAASVPANVVEGNARGSKRDYTKFLSIAKGSAVETETFLLLAIRLGFLTREETTPTLSLITEICKMLTALRSRLLERATDQE